jgi:glycosyltransferase involved in cell wall biosynthesis
MKFAVFTKACILIGGLSKRDNGAIPTITKEFIEGLQTKYFFVAHRADREYGRSSHARFNPLNIAYFFRHFISWVILLIRYRPNIAHYPITSYWNLEKSLVFMKVARLMGSRTVGHLHGGAFVEFWHSLPAWRKKPAAKELKSMDALVVLSEGWKSNMKVELGLPDSRVHVVHNLIERELEVRLLTMPTIRHSARVLCMGVMSRQKGMWEILECIKIARAEEKLRADLVGPDREPGAAKECKAWIDKNDLSSIIQIHGGVWEKEAKIELYKNAAMLLLPSHYENLPLVVMEAAAAGLPIIATPVGALPEFFHHDRSVLFVEPGDVQEIARSVQHLLRNTEVRARIGAAARVVFQQTFGREVVLSSLDEVYRAVLRREN